ncbi:MAG: tail fiber domain-containing protein [Ferruginibacter sp.]|nr:tail fiber domain-containing protein [Ferruginibacter sp.]
MKIAFTISLLCIFVSNSFAQSVAINSDGSTANPSAMLDIKSNTKGLLIPRMSKVQRNAITLPATGLIIFQNAPDSTGLYYYTGSRWQWMEESGKAWNINGNAGTSPFTNILGTSDNADLAIGVNNIPRLHVTNEAEVGIGFNNPSYGLDITTGNAAVNNCNYNGIRVKTVAAGFNNDCEKGLFMGYTDLNNPSNEGLIWNYGQSTTGTKTLALGVGSTLTMMRLTSNGLAGIGSGIFNPQYALDVNVGIGGVSPCSRNGFRLNTLQNISNPCENGLFLGYDVISDINKTSIWNFSADRFSANSIIRFGFGTDFSEAPGIGESMRILPPGKGVGINQINPVAMLHISNYTGGGVLPGVMVTNPTLPPNANGFYSGLKITGNLNEGYIWNYQNAATIFGTNDLERMRITEDGYVGININNPSAGLHVKDYNVLFASIGDVPVTPQMPLVNGPGRKLFWCSDKAAFRAGYVSISNWDFDETGAYSFATGKDTKASGMSSIALGTNTTASSGHTVAMGYQTSATNNYAVAMGNQTTASGISSFAIGESTTASSLASVAMGYLTTASGQASVAIGYQTSATSNYSVAMGNQTNASGNYAFSIGNSTNAFGIASFVAGSQNNASGNYSVAAGNNCIAAGLSSIATGEQNLADGSYSAAFGENVKALAYGSFVTGTFNDNTDSPNGLVPAPTDRILQIGNGNSSSRSNAFTILRNGNIGIGTTTPNALLQFPNNILNRKIVLWESANNDHQYYGLGINGGTFRYQVGGTTDNHVFYAGVNSTTSNELFRIQGNGNAILAGTLTQLSDVRLKKNIQPLQNSLKKLQQLNGYTYNWKDKNNMTLQIGLIAQEVQQQFPQLVVESNNKLSVNYSGMIPVLLEAIKDQQKQIDELKQLLLKNK